MVRRKALNPMQRIPSGEVMQTVYDQPDPSLKYTNGHIKSPGTRPTKTELARKTEVRAQAGIAEAAVCVAGIYASFLTWAYLQERITTTPYAAVSHSFLHPPAAQEYFRFPVVLNAIQSFFAFICGSAYLLVTTRSLHTFSKRAVIPPLLLVSVTSTLASPFGYASLAHVDYLTFVLAKSCKLLPVMGLHVTVFRKRYPLSKYLVVLAVTAGVVVFTIYQPPKPSSKSKALIKSSTYGLTLLGINLLLDGLTNTMQDHIFDNPRKYGPMKGPQLMVILNAFQTILNAGYLLILPALPLSLLPAVAESDAIQLTAAISFLQRHPSVFYDVLGFAACGAVGQIFIFAALERFSSLMLTTVTVTRKVLTMLISIVWFGKKLTYQQSLGVGLVFGGIGAEALLAQKEKSMRAKRRIDLLAKDR